MPFSAHAQSKRPARGSRQSSKPSKPSARSAAAKPAPARSAKPTPKPAAKPAGPAPVAAARTEFVAFNTSAFPYRGYLPDTRKPFLDARSGRRRGHTSLRGTVYWEDQTYSDRRSLLFLPPGFDPRRPAMIVVYFHGQGATLERDVVMRQAVPRQVAESGRNAVLVAPQLAYDAADSSAGNFWKPGHFAAFVDEAAERLMRLYGDRAVGRTFNLAPVVIVAYSGGYLPAAYALDRGGATHRVKGVILLDALYGDEDKFAAWVARRRRQTFLLSAYTESTREENGTLQTLLAKRRVSVRHSLPPSLDSGTVAFAACGNRDMHGDFVTRAWRTDPLRHALSMIPA
ncbi:alpha/beta hydrolase [Reyranella sp.]|uniref:alpha/beta hydrolase n=1 Tax=Reyranella sp. TaxID=1929291 RepID=UPI003BAAA2B1